MPLDPKEPPELGEITFSLPVAPVSQQAASAAKRSLVAEIRKITSPLEYILDGEVKIEIQWHIHERLRWETDASPDVDNILKPLLDGLCGRDGLLIDDCQVQSITAFWCGWTRDDQQLDIRVRFGPDEYLNKAGLSFVRVKDALCFPVPAEILHKGLTIWLDAIEGATQAREKIADLTKSYYPARYVLPRGLIHRSRIKEFPVHELEELRRLGE
jgi:Holliday junction resolvase RusA-like endonuclease